MLAFAAAPTLAFGQVGCLPPETPFAYEPPKDDPELREMINDDYQSYIRNTEAYLNCLNQESMRARTEYDAVLKRYMQYFGNEAGVRYEYTE